MNTKMNKAVIDNKIPYIKGLAEKLADEVVYLPGAEITAKDVKDADILIVRTRTRCNAELLEGSRVRFIATATIGYDHLDVDYLEKAGIQWTNCPGCNATSVGQYVRNSLLLWAMEKKVSLSSLCVGIVGVGNVGRAVHAALQPLGCRILLNDPPRAAAEGAAGFSTLAELQTRCDVITIHTPLTLSGPHPTFHLFNDAVLHHLSRRPLIINCGRGEVVDNEALEAALDEGRIAQAIIDTWENEPDIRLSLLEKVYLGTPHIAGYSADGKANATRMSLEAVRDYLLQRDDLGKERKETLKGMTFKIDLPEAHLPSSARSPELALYNPQDDSERLKKQPQLFEKLRGDYPLRREQT